jgi:Trypsin-co-occurring domain 1
MAQLAPVELGELTIYVETTDSAVVPGASRIVPAGAEDAAERAVEIGNRLTDAVAAMSKQVVDSFTRLEPEDRPVSAEVEFGLDVSVEGNVYVVKGSGRGTVTIRAQWRLSPGDDEPG